MCFNPSKPSSTRKAHSTGKNPYKHRNKKAKLNRKCRISVKQTGDNDKRDIWIRARLQILNPKPTAGMTKLAETDKTGKVFKINAPHSTSAMSSNPSIPTIRRAQCTLHSPPSQHHKKKAKLHQKQRASAKKTEDISIGAIVRIKYPKPRAGTTKLAETDKTGMVFKISKFFIFISTDNIFHHEPVWRSRSNVELLDEQSGH